MEKPYNRYEWWKKYAVLAAAASEILRPGDLTDEEEKRLEKLAQELGPEKGLTAALLFLCYVLEIALLEIGEHGSVLDLPLRALSVGQLGQ